MNTIAIRNLIVLFVSSAIALWASYNIASAFAFYSIPLIVGSGGFWCIGSLWHKLGFTLIPIAILGIRWLPESLASPDSEALGLVMMYLTIWSFGALTTFFAFEGIKYVLRRRAPS